MKVYLDTDEFYPFFSLMKEPTYYANEKEITEEQWAEYERVMAEFDKMHEWLSSL